MSIRLNKALRELNVGVQTAVDFLLKKNLGEVKADPNTKISDEQYDALVSEFKGDKDLRNQAEKLIHVHTKDKKSDRTKSETSAESLLHSNHSTYKPIGKIDLENIGKSPVAKVSAASEVTNVNETKVHPAVVNAPEQKKPAVEVEKPLQSEAPKATAPVASPQKEEQPEPVQPKLEQPKPIETSKPVQQPVQHQQPTQPRPQSMQNQQPKPQQPRPEQPKPAQKMAQQPQQPPRPQQPHPQYQQQPKPVQQQAQQQPKPQQPPAEKKVEAPVTPVTPEEPRIFTLKSESKMAPKVNVLGKIDLDAINQSTRPKKKTKEERRKEREEKTHQSNVASSERKKRVRINKERVDVNAAVNQNSNNNNSSNSNSNNNNNNNNRNRYRNNNSGTNPNSSGNNNSGNNGINSNNNANRNRNRRRNQPNVRPLEVNEQDVAKQVKETLARLTSKDRKSVV